MTTVAGIRVPALPLVVAVAPRSGCSAFRPRSADRRPIRPPDFGYYLQFVIGWALLATTVARCRPAAAPGRSATAETSRPADPIWPLSCWLRRDPVPEGRQPLGRRDDGRARGGTRAAVPPDAGVGGRGAFERAVSPSRAVAPGSIRRRRSGRAVIGIAGRDCGGRLHRRHRLLPGAVPAAALHLSPGNSALLAAILAAFGWLALRPPRSLAADRLAPRIAVGAALASGPDCCWHHSWVCARWPGWTWAIFAYLYLIPIVIVFRRLGLGVGLASVTQRRAADGRVDRPAGLAGDLCRGCV